VLFLTEIILEAREVVHQYPDGTRALNEITLSMEKGKKIAFLGPNGAGKSTLFLHFNGILKPARGKIIFKGREIRYDHASLTELRKNVGIVFQDPEIQLFSASVFQEISFGPLNMRLSREEVQRRVDRAMEITGITGLKNKATHYLSYGQKKRVSIADILAMDPQVILFDEPTSGLDPKLSGQMMELFDGFSREGKTVILSTHDVNAAYSWADHVIVIKDGSVAGEGAPEDIFQDDGLLTAADLDRPWLVDVYRQLRLKGLVAEGCGPPRTKEKLFELINSI
jgi:cobalt transport protein ATP-binding subunit